MRGPPVVRGSPDPAHPRPKGSYPEPPAPSSTIRKRGIKRHVTRLEVDLLHKLACLARPVLAFHANIFPLHRQRPFVLHLVERPDDLLEVHAAAARRAEVPTTTR